MLLLLLVYRCAAATPDAESFSYATRHRYQQEEGITPLYLPPQEDAQRRICLQRLREEQQSSFITQQETQYDFATTQNGQKAVLAYSYSDDYCALTHAEQVPLPLDSALPSRAEIPEEPLPTVEQGSSPLDNIYPYNMGRHYPDDYHKAATDDFPPRDTRPLPRPSMGFEYWRNFYASNILYDGRFYSFYVEKYDQNRMESSGIHLTLGNYTIQPFNEPPNNNISTAYSLSADVFGKFYADDILFIASPYAMFSIGVGVMWYEFNQPVINYYGNPITDDAMAYYELRGGIGGTLFRYGYLQISTYAGVDARIYEWNDTADYYNKLFYGTIAATWGASLGLRF